MSYTHDQYQYAPVALPQQHPSYNGSTFTQKSEGPPSTLLDAQQRASRKRAVRNTCLIATGILITLIGMMFAFLSFICIFHQCNVSKLSIVSTAPLGRVLTISQVTSHIAPLSVPIIMGLFSYLLSVRWLRSSVDGGPNRPSPRQLGLLMSMCNGAGLSSLFSSLKYVVQKPQTGQKAARPPILVQSMFFLGSLLTVTYITAAADSWLHASSTSVIISSNGPYKSTITPNFGREINATTCQLASQSKDGSPVVIAAATCGLLNDGVHETTAALGEGIRVVHNASTIHQMVLTDDETVIMIPLSVPSNITYSAKTLGVKSQCASITKQCLQPITSTDGTVSYGSDAVLSLDCTKGGIKYVNSTILSPLCALDSQGICTYGLDIPSNPFTTGEVTTSMAYIDPDTVYSTFLNNTFRMVFPRREWRLERHILQRQRVTLLDVTYTYQSSRYITTSASPKSLADTRAIMSAAFINLGTTVVSLAVEGSGIDADPPYERTYSWELSRQMLGRAAYIYGSTNVLDIQSENELNGSKLQLIPLVLFIAALSVFAIIIGTWGVEYVELAALHLSDPLTTMQRLYGHPDPALTWEADSSKKFGPETEGDRLRIGPVQLSNDIRQGSVFMVTKG
ncbi:hypothetical protein M413DRAFT_29853 [Hebeloma cylindrosporum]|uniref:Uncharacterized protein n=1 Tax=Hebeloma cylindrosporum TaxID=76867 RepID=A0A0C3BQL0_HEBCY|nr:hypothetical protein M413DRAFT_29853 [Hebeloma cylindrosporum h7]